MTSHSQKKTMQFLSLFSEETRLHDRLFYMAFYICLALLPPFIGVLGHKALTVPFVIISSLVVLRFIIDKQCRQRMLQCLSSSATISLLLLFSALLAIYAIGGVIADTDRLRILAKPTIFFLIAALLTFVWSHHSRLKRGLFFKLSLFGLMAGFAVTLLKIITSHMLGIGYRQDSNLLTTLFDINDTVNNELKILGVLAFIIALGINGTKRRVLFLVCFGASLLATSFLTASFKAYGGQAVIVHVESETVQFAIPLALVIMALTFTAHRQMTNLWFATLAFVVINAPWLFQLWFRFAETVPLPKARNILVRAEIWDGVAKKIESAPFLGYGIDSMRYLENLDLANNYMITDNPYHPHNMVLQLWLDMGLTSIFLVVVLVWLGWRYVSRLASQDQPLVLAGLSHLIIFMLVTHSIWQTWVLALLAYFTIIISLGSGSIRLRKTNDI